MARIYYVGDWAVLTGPNFIETPFHNSQKGLDIYNYGKWLQESLQRSGHTVASVPAWDFYKLGPGEYEKVLENHDVVVFSDVDAKLFQLAPNFFDRREFGTKVLTFPDRIRLTLDAVRAGKHAMFLGGWYSFTGELGKGGWGRTRLADLLPVTCLPTEDLIESTEGYTALVTESGRRQFRGVDLASMPPILGYNKVQERDGADVWVRVRETGDPLVAGWRVGSGRVLTYMSDPAPHWGCNFVFWDQFDAFWRECLAYLTNDGGHNGAAHAGTPLAAAK